MRMSDCIFLVLTVPDIAIIADLCSGKAADHQFFNEKVSTPPRNGKAWRLSMKCSSYLFVGVLGAYAVLVLTGLAVFAELDENDDPSDNRDQHKEIIRSGLADIVESAPCYGERGNENNEGINACKN